MVVGPLIAVLSFVCSVGNVPLAAVLWSGGISFAGVMAFIFADLIVLPIVARLPQVLRHGASRLRITALMFVTMVLAALVVDGLFCALGLIPTARAEHASDVFGSIEVDYKLVAQRRSARSSSSRCSGSRARRGATDPVCGMRVDRSKALTATVGGRRHFFCSEHCKSVFEAEPERYVTKPEGGDPSTAAPIRAGR